MVKCCVPMCLNASYNKTPEITFHRFPKREHLKNVWLKHINRKHWQPKANSVLCSTHFEANLICIKGHRSYLSPSAIPTIFKEEITQDNKENVQADVQETHQQPSCSNKTTKLVEKETHPQPSCSNETNKAVENETHEQPGCSKKTNEAVEKETHPQPSCSNKTNKAVEKDTHPQPSCSNTTNKAVEKETHPQPSCSYQTNKAVETETHQQPSCSNKTIAITTIPDTAISSNVYITSSQYLSKNIADNMITVTKLRNRIKTKNKTIKRLQEQNRRCRKKVQQLSVIIAELQKKINEKQLSVSPVRNEDVMVKYIERDQSSNIEKPYPTEVIYLPA